MSFYTDAQIQFIVEQKQQNPAAEWKEISEKFNIVFNENKAPHAIRKAYRRFENLHFNESVFVKNFQEKLRTQTDNSYLNKQNKILGNYLNSQEDFMEEVKELLKPENIKYHKQTNLKKIEGLKRTIVATLSDTHFGLNISENEVGRVNKYNNIIAARRLAFYTNEIANYKRHHRKETDLVLVLNGDILAGIIHNQEFGVERMSTQFAMTLSYLIQSLTYLSQHFQNIKVLCTVGNHGRYTHKDNRDRQTYNKWDSFETMVYSALKLALNSYPNIQLEQSEAPFVVFKVFTHNFYATHGDTNLRIENPGKVLNMDKLINKVNKINVELFRNQKETIDVVLLGHHHTTTLQMLNDGSQIIINGCLSGLDPFANSIDIYSSHPTQLFFETTEKDAVGDMRIVKVNRADNNEELDKIIKPFNELF